MTIGGLVAWLGDRSAWWLLAIPPAIWLYRLLNWGLWRYSMRKRLRHVVKASLSARAGGRYDDIAQLEWVRQRFVELLLAGVMGIPHDEVAAYTRQTNAIEDAGVLAERQTFVEETRVALRAEAMGSAHPADGDD